MNIGTLYANKFENNKMVNSYKSIAYLKETKKKTKPVWSYNLKEI